MCQICNSNMPEGWVIGIATTVMISLCTEHPQPSGRSLQECRVCAAAWKQLGRTAI